MTEEQSAAYVNAQTIAARAEVEGMVAENQQRAACGNAMAFDGADFETVIEKYGLHHNALIALFNSSEVVQ